MYIISNPFFENQPNEICSYLSEKASKGRFLKPQKLQIHSNEGKGKEKKKRARRRKGEEKKKKAIVTLLEKNCWTQKVRLVVKLSKIQLLLLK